MCPHQSKRSYRIYPVRLSAYTMTPTKIVKKGKSKKAVLAVGGGVGEETQLDGTCVGGRSPVVYGGRIERQKNKNRESNGVLSFDGFQWMGGHNNQTRFGLSRGCTGEFFSVCGKKSVGSTYARKIEAKKTSRQFVPSAKSAISTFDDGGQYPPKVNILRC